VRRHLAWILVAAGVVAVVVVAAVIGNRDKSGETVPAGEWAQSVCGSVGVWRGQIEAIVEDVRTPNASSTAGGEEPQSETPQGRTGFIRKGLERAVQATETVVVGIDNAGIPDTSNGESSAAAVSDWADGALDDLEQAQDSLDGEAETLEEAIEQAVGAVSAVGSTLASGVQTVADVARDDPELADAIEQSSTCQELREEAGDS
jgi:hypothetical protein